MSTQVESLKLFHVTRELPYNPHGALEVGGTITCGTDINPFFGFYEKARLLSVTMQDGSIVEVPAIRWLRAVHAGQITPPDLPLEALNIAMHFQMLSRELIMESVRLDVSPCSPSRYSCLWTASSLAIAQSWMKNLGGTGRILELSATGTVAEADSNLLAGDAAPYSQIIENARDYWAGKVSSDSAIETLFAGIATVTAIIN